MHLHHHHEISARETRLALCFLLVIALCFVGLWGLHERERAILAEQHALEEQILATRAERERNHEARVTAVRAVERLAETDMTLGNPFGKEKRP
jgi:hypothetical protein